MTALLTWLGRILTVGFVLLWFVFAHAQEGAWGFEEQAGQIAIDVSANGHHAWRAATTRVPGRYGLGVRLTAAEEVAVLEDPVLPASAALTISLAVRPAGACAQRCAVLRTRNATTAAALVLEGDRLAFVTRLTPTAPWLLHRSTAPVAPSVWTDLAGVLEPSGTVRLYHDGSLVPTTTVPAPGGTSAYVGDLDEVRYYRTAVSTDVVQRDRLTAVEPQP